ncbi:MAG: hypothetical protein WA936_06745 [Erythrobacter sp.]|uniref:hypothetical protein n=1 Tax=Erythrobacter sp. TaxID=1042 RepID=UPI003C77F437
MTYLEILWFAVSIAGFAAWLTIILANREVGSTALAATLCAVFLAYTLFQIGAEGVVGFFANHTSDLTGLQVWWDLIMSVLVALFLIAPRARRAGMNLPAWAALVGLTASIGLLAMCARLFWLEREGASSAIADASPA